MSSPLSSLESDRRNLFVRIREQLHLFVSMTKDEKVWLITKAKQHGLSLSAFFCLAADEYIANHNW